MRSQVAENERTRRARQQELAARESRQLDSAIAEYASEQRAKQAAAALHKQQLRDVLKQQAE